MRYLTICTPVGNRIQFEDEEVIVKPSVLKMNCSVKRWLQTDQSLKQIGSAVELQQMLQ